MRRASLAVAPALAAVVLAGCGTIANFGDRGWQNSRIYGGVQRDVKSTEQWIEDNPISAQTDLMHDVGTVVGVGLIGLDVPLSAIADTLTLPITVPVALWGGPGSAANVSRKPAAASPPPKTSAPAGATKPAN